MSFQLEKAVGCDTGGEIPISSRVLLLTDKHVSRCEAYWKVSNLLADLFSGQKR